MGRNSGGITNNGLSKADTVRSNANYLINGVKNGYQTKIGKELFEKSVSKLSKGDAGKLADEIWNEMKSYGAQHPNMSTKREAVLQTYQDVWASLNKKANAPSVKGKNTSGQSAYQKATGSLYSAYESKNKTGIDKATKRVTSLISKQSDAVVKERAKSFSDATYLSHKKNNPKSEYSAAAYNYNKRMSTLYNREAKRRKLV
jgi:hypothetical protein